MWARLNEAVTHYSWEGWDCFYLAVAGSNCNIILDMFSELFGPPSRTELEDLDEPTRKKTHTKPATFEEEILKQEGVPDTSKAKTVYLTSMSMSYSMGIPVDYFPQHNRLRNPARPPDEWLGALTTTAPSAIIGLKTGAVPTCTPAAT